MERKIEMLNKEAQTINDKLSVLLLDIEEAIKDGNQGLLRVHLENHSMLLERAREIKNQINIILSL